MVTDFGDYLSSLRRQAGLTNKQLANRADVPRSLIAGLQSGRRTIGEIQAKRLGLALGLEGKDFESFILSAIDTCTDKVLREVKGYPSHLINVIPKQLKKNNILPEDLHNYAVIERNDEFVVKLYLNNGSIINLTSTFKY